MIDANVWIDAETRITWHKTDDAGTVWVKLDGPGAKLVIFTETVEDAKALVSLLWRIRQHNDPKGMEAKYDASIAKLVNSGI